MSESLIAVTEGSGKNSHTWQRVIGSNTVEDTVVLLGEQYLSTYTLVTSGGISTATANSHLLQGMAGASLKVRLRKIEVYQTVAVTTAAIMGLELWRLSTAGTGGTAYTPAAFDPSDAAAGATSQSAPTVKGTEILLVWTGGVYLMQTVAASNQLVEPILTIDFDRLRSKPLIVNAGTSNGFALKNTTGHAAGGVRIVATIDESNFA